MSSMYYIVYGISMHIWIWDTACQSVWTCRSAADFSGTDFGLSEREAQQILTFIILIRTSSLVAPCNSLCNSAQLQCEHRSNQPQVKTPVWVYCCSFFISTGFKNQNSALSEKLVKGGPREGKPKMIIKQLIDDSLYNWTIKQEGHKIR